LKKLNILYHHRTQGRGAEGTHIISIIRGFEALGHTVTLVSPPGIDPLKEIGAPPVDKTNVKTTGLQSFWKFISKHMPNPVFELAEIAYNLQARRLLEQAIKQDHYDMIFERYAFFLIAGRNASRKYGIPLMLEANEVSGIENRARRQSFRWLCDRFEKALFRQAHSIFTVSSKLKSMIVDKGTDPEKVVVLPNAIEPSEVKVTVDRDTLRNQYNLAADKLVIGFAGWFDNWDRLDFLLDVFGDLKAQHDNIAICLIGDGPVMSQIRSEIAQRNLVDDVVLTGPVPRKEIYNYLSMLDIAILPHSNNFGSPVILFEMMGLKLPIVAPKLPPILDVLEDGNTALLFEPLDHASCRQALARYIESGELRSQCAKNANELVLSNHSWTENSRKIVARLPGQSPDRRS